MRSSALMTAHWMDFLNFDGAAPQFDVLERTKMIASFKTRDQLAPYLADDYIFRGSIVGPITMEAVSDTQGKLDIQAAFPDLDRGIFGFTLDPQNPFRCFFFERWTATHSGEMIIDGLPEFIGRFPPTGNKIELPIHISSIVWNPEGKIIYQSISPPIDRFEGNTRGIGANYGLLVAAGVTSGKNEHVGNPFLMLQQKLFQALVGTFWSDDEKVPDWWKSKAKGADPIDL